MGIHLGLVESGVKDFDVASAAVDPLLVPDTELDHQDFALVAERFHARRERVEVRILAGLHACNREKRGKAEKTMTQNNIPARSSQDIANQTK